MLDVRKLVLLREVAARGSITAAAKALNFTRSAVSQQLSALEGDAGVELLRRTNDRTELTPAGVVLLEYTERVLAELRAAETALAGGDGVSGSLRVGVPFRDGPRIMLSALTSAKARYPGLDIVIRGISVDAGPREVRLGHLDIAVLAVYDGQPGVDLASVELVPVRRDGLQLAVAADDPLGRPGALTKLADLADRPWVIGTGSALGERTVRLCREAGFSPRVVADVEDVQVALELVTLGWGVMLVPELTPSGHAFARVAVPDLRASRRTFVVLRNGSRRQPAVAAVVSEIEAAGNRLS